MIDNTPEDFYRGLPSPDTVTEQGYPTESAFRFLYFGREDGYSELSINWNDDEGALEKLLSQRKPFKEEPQFKIGYCKIEKSMMKMLMKTYMDDQVFSYERRPVEADLEADVESNPYHGNLLMKKDAGNALKKNIQCGLAALAAGTFVRRKEE